MSSRVTIKVEADEAPPMSQTTLTDEDLFGEAADEIQADIESCLEAGREALPTDEEVWAVNADNVLGVLNALRSSLTVEEATEHVHDAKKWYLVGERADVFDDPEAIETSIEDLEAVIDRIEATRADVTSLINEMPDLKGRLEDLHATDGNADDEDADDA